MVTKVAFQTSGLPSSGFKCSTRALSAVESCLCSELAGKGDRGGGKGPTLMGLEAVPEKNRRGWPLRTVLSSPRPVSRPIQARLETAPRRRAPGGRQTIYEKHWLAAAGRSGTHGRASYYSATTHEQALARLLQGVADDAGTGSLTAGARPGERPCLSSLAGAASVRTRAGLPDQQPLHGPAGSCRRSCSTSASPTRGAADQGSCVRLALNRLMQRIGGRPAGPC